jgi:apoptosis-inducing factor 2
MQKLLIVGGGYTSMYLAQSLKDSFEITIIEPKSVFYHYIGGLRGLIDPDFDANLSFQYSSYHVIHAKVESIDFALNSVHLSDKTTLKYDKVVIATGVEHGIFTKNGDLTDLRQKIKDAKSILVVGGGPIGIELIGEIHDYYPQKILTLQHNHPELLSPQYPHRLRTSITNLVSKHAQIVDTNTNSADFDLVIQSFGMKPNSSFIDKKYLDDRGYIPVDKYLQISGLQNAFVLGDINTADTVKTLVNGKAQAAVLAKNLQGNKKSYISPKNPLIGIPFGKTKGRISLPFGIVLGNLPISIIKGKTLFIGMIQKLFA